VYKQVYFYMGFTPGIKAFGAAVLGGIDWSLLAGIGREESDHGRFAGAVLHPDGTSTPQIVGRALDGTHSDYIAAPANGVALDGDARYTNALGPMQFIPQTWAAYGADANGDGRADVFNINDAALGAARYLCANGGNLRTQGGRIAAVLAYNHNDEYVAQVLALAEAYRTGTTISGVPVGQLFGALPPITPGPPLAVNPGAPTAVDPTYVHHRPTTKPGTATSGGTRQGTAPGSGPAAGSKPGKKQPGSGSGSKPGGSAPGPPAPSPSPTGGVLGPVQVPVVPGPNPSATPSPAPSPTCHLGLAGTCVLP
ncbi:MAG: lytic murein transglycosylase, partial [Jatrophihabitantaceae bacterium]